VTFRAECAAWLGLTRLRRHLPKEVEGFRDAETSSVLPGGAPLRHHRPGTRRPREVFTTSIVDIHDHEGARQSYQVSEGPASPRTGKEWHRTRHAKTRAAGEHQHTIAPGGDRETRRINLSLTWLIRAK